MPPDPVRFYFDYVSPYAYIAWVRARRRIAAGTFPAIEPVPVLFAGLLKHHGQLGPAEIPAKRAFTARDCARVAAADGIPIAFPPVHPFNPLLALRLSLRSVAGGDQDRVIDGLWGAGWGRGAGLADEGEVAAVLDGLGLDAAALIARTREQAIKDELRANTEAAIAAGIFGVPSFDAGGEILWGSDRLDHVADAALDEARRERVRAIVSDAPFVGHLGIELTGIGAGWVSTELAIRPEMLQQDGVVHAGVIATLVDHTAGAAAGSTLGPGRTPLTVELKVNMLRPATGERLRCRARVLRAGRRLVVAESEAFAADKLVAKAIVTLAPLSESELRR